MTICYLGLGSNLKTPPRQLRLAIKSLRHLPRTTVLSVASFYANPAWGIKAQPLYYNTVVKIKTTLPPFCLLKQCLAIEKQQGRARKRKWGARTIDIDLLYYGNLSLKTPDLTLPHPRIEQRDFVKIPLEEVFNLGK